MPKRLSWRRTAGYAAALFWATACCGGTSPSAREDAGESAPYSNPVTSKWAACQLPPPASANGTYTLLDHLKATPAGAPGTEVRIGNVKGFIPTNTSPAITQAEGAADSSLLLCQVKLDPQKYSNKVGYSVSATLGEIKVPNTTLVFTLPGAVLKKGDTVSFSTTATSHDCRNVPLNPFIRIPSGKEVCTDSTSALPPIRGVFSGVYPFTAGNADIGAECKPVHPSVLEREVTQARKAFQDTLTAQCSRIDVSLDGTTWGWWESGENKGDVTARAQSLASLVGWASPETQSSWSLNQKLREQWEAELGKQVASKVAGLAPNASFTTGAFKVSVSRPLACGPEAAKRYKNLYTRQSGKVECWLELDVNNTSANPLDLALGGVLSTWEIATSEGAIVSGASVGVVTGGKVDNPPAKPTLAANATQTIILGFGADKMPSATALLRFREQRSVSFLSAR